MVGTRRWFLTTATAGGAAWLASCGPAVVTRPEPSRSERLDQALLAASRFLIGRQSSDGSWVSDVYGPFKDGRSLTPLVLRALLTMSADKDVVPHCRRGADYLAAQVQSDGSIDAGPHGLAYPVYTSAGAVLTLSHPVNAHHVKARDGWLAYLRQRQLTEDLGWQPADQPYGGWGYAPHLPRKPKAGEPLRPLTESNLSATLFALEALKAAGAKADDPALPRALVFIKCCQNYSDDPQQRERAFDDGGFFFRYEDAARNKAGVAGKDRAGRERYFSYGSTTADGWRALLLCGRPADDPRVAAARAWLEVNFRADLHAGHYAKDREHNRGAVYYYYCCSLAQGLQDARLTNVQTPAGKVEWAVVLADELMRRQRPDGSWINPLVPQREDDPLVASSMAVLALACCRESLTAQ